MPRADLHMPELPQPAHDALHASQALCERIAMEIATQGGWISFARYMELALHAPGLGYYAGGSTKLGAGGDFVTAPELGSLFARTLARQVAQLLPEGGDVLEFGAGSGALAETLAAELAALGHPPANYLILEPSAELAARQRARLAAGRPQAGFRFQWLSRLPAGFRGVMLANEVVDAMPCHALAWTPRGILERGVIIDCNSLAWSDRTASGEVLHAASELPIDLPPCGRFESELNLAARAWMRALGGALGEGAILIVDYGFSSREYYHAQRSSGTLMCHYRHRAHGDPFFLPGLQDITAHVDFSALADAAAQSGLDVLGYASQAQFLINCGITELLAQSDPSNAPAYAPRAAEAHKLLSPAEMGELFKVLALGRRRAPEGALGFARGDRARTL